MERTDVDSAWRPGGRRARLAAAAAASQASIPDRVERAWARACSSWATTEMMPVAITAANAPGGSSATSSLQPAADAPTLRMLHFIS
jgi:hypothetical protein